MFRYQNNPLSTTLNYYASILGKKNYQSLNNQELAQLQSFIIRIIESRNTSSLPTQDRTNIGVHRLQQDVNQINMIVDTQHVPLNNGGDMTRQFRTDKIVKNPYSYGVDHKMLDPQVQTVYQGQYLNNPEMIRDMGLNPQHHSYSNNGIRNTDVESSLVQSEGTHTPGQHTTLPSEVDRFNILPFNPQNPDGYTWRDNMPRGGYSTRSSSNAKYSL